MTTFNETNLPDRFLEPPMPAPHRFSRLNWKRNWSILCISLNWNGRNRGRYELLADWVAGIDHQKRLTKQRIEQINKQTLWALRDYLEFKHEYEKMK